MYDFPRFRHGLQSSVVELNLLGLFFQRFDAGIANKFNQFFNLKNPIWSLWLIQTYFSVLTLSSLTLHCHLHPLQAANCCRNARLVVDEDDLMWVKN